MVRREPPGSKEGGRFARDTSGKKPPVNGFQSSVKPSPSSKPASSDGQKSSLQGVWSRFRDRVTGLEELLEPHRRFVDSLTPESAHVLEKLDSGQERVYKSEVLPAIDAPANYVESRLLRAIHQHIPDAQIADMKLDTTGENRYAAEGTIISEGRSIKVRSTFASGVLNITYSSD